jgi:flavin-binding protein dodecin
MVMKVIEVLSESTKSWEDAAQVAVTEAHKSIRGIASIFIKDFSAHVVDGKITNYRVNAKITFKLEE